MTGFEGPNVQEMSADNRRRLESAGVCIFTGQHAFGGVGRAVRNKLGTYQVDEIMAFTLRTFGQGTKVAVEIALMAADAGLVRTDEDIISMGGTGKGVDTALVIRPSNSFRFFELKVREVICKPQRVLTKGQRKMAKGKRVNGKRYNRKEKENVVGEIAGALC